jgi:hypothetical protein
MQGYSSTPHTLPPLNTQGVSLTNLDETRLWWTPKKALTWVSFAECMREHKGRGLLTMPPYPTVVRLVTLSHQQAPARDRCGDSSPSSSRPFVHIACFGNPAAQVMHAQRMEA